MHLDSIVTEGINEQGRRKRDVAVRCCKNNLAGLRERWQTGVPPTWLVLSAVLLIQVRVGLLDYKPIDILSSLYTVPWNPIYRGCACDIM